MSLAEVIRGGINPGLAATDYDAFVGVNSPAESTAVSELTASGRIFVVPEGTRCRIIAHSNQRCQGEHYPARVKLTDGPRRGQIVWMCSDSLTTLYKWP